MSGEGLDGESTVHRGVRWHRDITGRITWFDDDLNQWVRWRPGGDAPPRPPGWEGPDRLSSSPPLRRPGWRSPYRLVPLVLAAFIVVVGAFQALHSTNPVAAEAKAAQNLQGRCLHQNGQAEGHPRYASGSVACTSASATVKVVAVLPGTPGSPTCPAKTASVQIAYAGVAYPHVECIVPVGVTTGG